MMYADKVDYLGEIIGQLQIKLDKAGPQSKQGLFEAIFWLNAIKEKQDALALQEAESFAKDVAPSEVMIPIGVPGASVELTQDEFYEFEGIQKCS